MEPSLLFTNVTADSAKPVDATLRNGLRLTERRSAAIVASNARLSHSMSQRGRSVPTHGGTYDFPSQGFQVFYFKEAALALPQVLLVGQ